VLQRQTSHECNSHMMLFRVRGDLIRSFFEKSWIKELRLVIRRSDDWSMSHFHAYL
jgi:hypothetical protein